MARLQCPGCGYVYDERLGDEHEGFPPGTSWRQIPENWACASCAVRDKADFVALEAEVADSAAQAERGAGD